MKRFLVFLVLLWMYFATPEFFWMGVIILVLLVLVYFYSRKRKKEYVDNVEIQVVKLEIMHPIRTGFQFALGMGFFAIICLLAGIILLVILVGSALYGIWSLISPYLPI